MSHELTAYLSTFNQFKLNELWPYYQKHVKQIVLNCTTLLCFGLALLHSVSYYFSLYQSPSSSLCMLFDFILSDIDEVLPINPSASGFVFEDFNVDHKVWLTYSGGTD